MKSKDLNAYMSRSCNYCPGNRSIFVGNRGGWVVLNSGHASFVLGKNYAMRFSGPVTALTGRRVRYGCRSPPHLPARSSAKYKTCSSPPPLFNSSLRSLYFPFTLLHGHRASGLTELHPFLARPLCPTERYDAASENNTSSQLPALIRSPLGSIVSSTVSTVTAAGLHSIMASTKCLAFQVPGDLVTRRPWTHYHRYLPSSRLYQCISPPQHLHCGLIIPRQHLDWLPH